MMDDQAERKYCQVVADQRPHGWTSSEVQELLLRERCVAYQNGFQSGLLSPESERDIKSLVFEAPDGTWIGMCEPCARIPIVRSEWAGGAEFLLESLVEGTERLPLAENLAQLERCFEVYMRYAVPDGGAGNLAWYTLSSQDRERTEREYGVTFPRPENIPLSNDEEIKRRIG